MINGISTLNLTETPGFLDGTSFDAAPLSMSDVSAAFAYGFSLLGWAAGSTYAYVSPYVKAPFIMHKASDSMTYAKAVTSNLTTPSQRSLPKDMKQLLKEAAAFTKRLYEQRGLYPLTDQQLDLIKRIVTGKVQLKNLNGEERQALYQLYKQYNAATQNTELLKASVSYGHKMMSYSLFVNSTPTIRQIAPFVYKTGAAINYFLNGQPVLAREALFYAATSSLSLMALSSMGIQKWIPTAVTHLLGPLAGYAQFVMLNKLNELIGAPNKLKRLMHQPLFKMINDYYKSLSSGKIKHAKAYAALLRTKYHVDVEDLNHYALTQGLQANEVALTLQTHYISGLLAVVNDDQKLPAYRALLENPSNKNALNKLLEITKTNKFLKMRSDSNSDSDKMSITSELRALGLDVTNKPSIQAAYNLAQQESKARPTDPLSEALVAAYTKKMRLIRDNFVRPKPAK